MSDNGNRGGEFTTRPNGKKLRELRGTAKQHDVEDASGLPYGQLTRAETGKPVGIKYISMLADHYGVTVKSLLTEDGMKIIMGLITDLAKIAEVRVDFSTSSPYNNPSQAAERFEIPGDPEKETETEHVLASV